MAVKVMIADDHSLIREGLKQLLELEGDFQVIAEACDGIDCMEKLKEQIPDVLLLDINMPRMNGLEVLQKIKDEKIDGDRAFVTVEIEVDDYSKVLKSIPSDLSEVAEMVKKGLIKVQLEHKKLDILSNTLDGLADRLSYSIVLASLIISSAFILSAKIPPLIHDVSIIGVIGFVISGIMGFIMIISRFIKKYINKNKK